MKKAQILAEKLARHAKSAKEIGNLEEAMAFAAKAAELSDKYGFEVPDGTHEDDLFVTYYWENLKYYQDRYACRLADIYGVQGILNKYKKKTGHKSYVILHGKQQNIDLVLNFHKIVLPSIEKELQKALSIYLNEVEEYGFDKKSNKYRNLGYKFRKDFYTGVGDAIKQRIELARKKYNAKLTDLMINEKQQALADYQKDNRTSKTSRKVGAAAYEAGEKVGSVLSAGKSLGFGNKLLK